MWTLCSVRDAHAALREVHRVLASSGRFLFLEHGRAAEPRIARWQDRLTPIQKRLAGGCHLNRPMDRWVREAGFELESLERYRLSPGPKVATQIYRGSARPV
jgi:ubiquinone/menaquinone biosynthesis C-methylase UbiE